MALSFRALSGAFAGGAFQARSIVVVALLATMLSACCACGGGSGDGASADGLALESFTLVNHLEPCDGETRHDLWTNNTGSTWLVSRLEMFEGVNLNGTADVYFKVGKLPDDSIIGTYPRDAYAGSNRDPHPHVVNFSPDYVVIEPGEGLVAHQWCQDYGGSDQILFTATIWYAQAPAATEAP